jgi:hypothetical protein
LDSSIFVLNINERAALLAILKIWKDDSGRRWLMNQDEYERNFDTEEFDEFVPEPLATPEEVEKYQIDQDIEDVVNTPVVDQDNFGDNFDIISTPPVIEKFNIEESKPEVVVMETEFETDNADNDFWRQHIIPEDEEDLKKNF